MEYKIKRDGKQFKTELNKEAIEKLKNFSEELIYFKEDYNEIKHLLQSIINRIYKNNLHEGGDTFVAGKEAYNKIVLLEFNKSSLILIKDESVDENECYVFNRLGDYIYSGILPEKYRYNFVFDKPLDEYQIPNITVTKIENGAEFPDWVSNCVFKVKI